MDYLKHPRVKKYIQPVLARETMLAFTVSPPEKYSCNFEPTCCAVEFYCMKENIKMFMVSEKDPKGRLHYHGALGLNKQQTKLQWKYIKDLKDMFKNKAFIDIKPVNSATAWMVYCLKDCTKPGLDQLHEGFNFPLPESFTDPIGDDEVEIDVGDDIDHYVD